MDKKNMVKLGFMLGGAAIGGLFGFSKGGKIGGVVGECSEQLAPILEDLRKKDVDVDVDVEDVDVE